jgi:hypothetical protein
MASLQSPAVPDLDLDAPQVGPETMRRLQRLERWYMTQGWYARPAQLRQRVRSGHPVVVTAGHAASQWRRDFRKAPDAGTGGMAELLAELTGSSVLAVAGRQDDDPNFDIAPGRFKQTLRGMIQTPRVVVDLHGLQGQHGIDIDLGLGLNPSPAMRAFAEEWRAEAERRGLVATIGVPYGALPPGTITNWAQSEGLEAIQVEMGPRVRDPESPMAAVGVEWLRDMTLAVARLVGKPDERAA